MPISAYTYTLRDPARLFTWTGDLAQNTNTGVIVDCGGHTVTFSETSIPTRVPSFVDNPGQCQYDSTSFNVDYMETLSTVGEHTISYHVHLTAYPTVTVSCNGCFTLTINDPCDPPASIVLSGALEDQDYQLNDAMRVYTTPAFETSPSWCTIT